MKLSIDELTCYMQEFLFWRMDMYFHKPIDQVTEADLRLLEDRLKQFRTGRIRSKI